MTGKPVLCISLFISLYKITVFAMSISLLTWNLQKYLNIGGGSNCDKTRHLGRVVTGGKMKSVHFILSIAFA